MLDEVLGGDCHNNYLYICSDCGVQESKRVAQEFVDMLYYDNIERIKVLMTKTPQVQTKSGQSFRFVDIQSVMNEDFWHGTHYDRVFVDIGQDWLQSPHKEALEFEIKCRGGDWV